MRRLRYIKYHPEPFNVAETPEVKLVVAKLAFATPLPIPAGFTIVELAATEQKTEVAPVGNVGKVPQINTPAAAKFTVAFDVIGKPVI